MMYTGGELPNSRQNQFFLAIVSQLKNTCCTQSPLVNVKLVLAGLVAQHSRIRWPEDFVFSGPITKGQAMNDLSQFDIEIWKDIPGYPDYEVSNLGRVRTWKGFGRRKLRNTPALKQLSIDSSGYPYCGLINKDGKGKRVRVHSLVMWSFVGPQPTGMHVCHSDNNPENNCLDNLRYDTPEANARDYRQKKTSGKVTLTIKPYPGPPPTLSPGKTIWIDRDTSAIVSAKDHDLVSEYNWHLHSSGYAATKINGKTVLMHRLINNPGNGYDVDHINHNKLDNRRGNLRTCTRSQNQGNQKKGRGSHTSDYKGVDRREDLKKWRATIRVNYKKIHLGLFKEEKDAARAYDNAAIEYFGDFAYTNFKTR